MSVKVLKINSAASKIILLAVGLSFVVAVYFFAKWEIADSVASKAAYKEIAEAAVDLAPSAPKARFVWAALLEKTFIPEDLPKSLEEYEQAAALAPNNYLMWLALGRARSRSGDASGAEKALRKAQELAPHYAQIQWTLGNLLVRQGKTDEGFSQIQQAAAGDPNFNFPAILAAWQTTGEDVAQTRRILGDTPAINAALVGFLPGQKHFDDALEIWNALPADEKKTTLKATGQNLADQFLAAKNYFTAQQILRQISDANNFAVGEITNGGFESDINVQTPIVFQWQLADAPQPQIRFDAQQKHGGGRSLLISYNSPLGKDFRAVSQIVTVEAGKSYDFNAFYKSDLKTTATFDWEITDSSGKVLAATAPTEAKTTDWLPLQAKFTAPDDRAIVVRLARVACKSSGCPVYGRILFDDFSLTKN